MSAHPGFSIPIFLTLLAILAASVGMFALLVRRWTTHRKWVSLAEWVDDRKMTLAKDLGMLPPPIDRLAERGVLVRLRIDDAETATTIVQFQTHPGDSATSSGAFGNRVPGRDAATQFEAIAGGGAQIGDGAGGGAASESGAYAVVGATSTVSSGQPNWNVLIRRVGAKHAPAALRPAHAGRSAIDLFELARFHGWSNDRFAVFAADARSAARLAKSSARALLPADVGLLLYDDRLLLDFSARPFDPIELDRMLSVANQLSFLT